MYRKQLVLHVNHLFEGRLSEIQKSEFCSPSFFIQTLNFWLSFSVRWDFSCESLNYFYWFWKFLLNCVRVSSDDWTSPGCLLLPRSSVLVSGEGAQTFSTFPCCSRWRLVSRKDGVKCPTGLPLWSDGSSAEWQLVRRTGSWVMKAEGLWYVEILHFNVTDSSGLTAGALKRVTCRKTKIIRTWS